LVCLTNHRQQPQTVRSRARRRTDRAGDRRHLGEQASWRYVEFFTVHIRNPNTRRAYRRACRRFLGWCEERGLTLATIKPFDVATYMEALRRRSAIIHFTPLELRPFSQMAARWSMPADGGAREPTHHEAL
jgi:hypothetical protein